MVSKQAEDRIKQLEDKRIETSQTEMQSREKRKKKKSQNRIPKTKRCNICTTRKQKEKT